MWAVIKNYFQDYKIYADIMKMLIMEFLNNLSQTSKVKMWAVIKNYFQEYKIYAKIINMFIMEFLNNLPQP